MTQSITTLHNSSQIRTTLSQIAATRLAHRLGSVGNVDQATKAIPQLRVAASVALAQLISNKKLNQLLPLSTSNADSPPLIITNITATDRLDVFYKWSGYLDALLESKSDNKQNSDNKPENEATPSINDLFFYTTAGFLAQKPTDVRHTLRLPTIRATLDTALQTVSNLPWPNRVQTLISLALLFLVRQETHNDILKAGQVMQNLTEAQKTIKDEELWLQSRQSPQQDAFSLLGLYHLAQAVNQVAEFLLSGAIDIEGQLLTNIIPILNRLLSRAEEYLLLSRQLEIQFWLNAAAILLFALQDASIWVTARGLSPRIDQLLTELAHTGRQNPIFSLLPAQQDALRQNLLDPEQIAVILQMPTSTGKTLLAEFSIVQIFETYQSAKVVYITPTRALATQTRRTLTEDLGVLKIQVSGAGSAFEEDPYEQHLLQNSDGVLVTTPEKLDLLLRIYPTWFNNLRLVVVDEAHLLSDSERGVRLELLLANIRREQPQTRLLLLTPFIQNASQIATWLAGSRSLPITVNWRPARLWLGLAQISGRGTNRALTVDWVDPYIPGQEPADLHLPTTVLAKNVQSTLNRIVYLADVFKELGTVLAMFSGSRRSAEIAAQKVAEQSSPLPTAQQTPALQVAIALAKNDYGSDSPLAYCLQRGVTFHHAALSSTLRYLIEDQVRAKTIQFIAATTTLAQGLNFPVATVLIHSVNKPREGGNLSPAEFWNIAGRAGRVGLADKGLVVFANPHHKKYWQTYAKALNETLQSALLQILSQLDPNLPLQDLYQNHPPLRPFLQYLAHVAAHSTPTKAIANLDSLINASLASVQLQTVQQRQALRQIAENYLQQIAARSTTYLKTTDSTGLASFSFDTLNAIIKTDPLLNQGPQAILETGQTGLIHLFKALQTLPELNLGLTSSSSKLTVDTAAALTHGWLTGQSIATLASHFPAEDPQTRIRETATYLHSTISQNLSWGTHAYIRSWLMNQTPSPSLSPHIIMLPAYIEYGVNTPEAAVASLLNIPRQLTTAFTNMYRQQHPPLAPTETAQFKTYIEEADQTLWTQVIAQSPLAQAINPAHLRLVWRQMQGLK